MLFQDLTIYNGMTKYYVYTLTDPRDNVPFYVGKGSGLRYKAHESEARTGDNRTNRKKCDHIREIWESGLNVVYHFEECSSEEAAYALEQESILRHGRRTDNTGTLFNVQSGGPDKRHESTRAKRIYVYDQTGNLASMFNSGKESAAHFKCDPSIINKRAKQGNAYNGLWVLSHIQLTEDGVRDIFQSSRPGKRRVQQCDDEWNVVCEYDSTYEAARGVPGIREDTIYATLRAHATGQRKSPRCGGFLWKFAD